MTPSPAQPEEQNSSLTSRMASGAAWMILFRLSERSLGLISTVILARLLVPADFGLVAMATTVIAFLEVFTMNDFASAIIQNRSAVRGHYDTAWTMDIVLGIVAGVTIALLAIPASHYFNDPRLVPILLALSIYPLFDGAFNVGCIDFRKNLQFDKEFLLQVTKKLSGIVISIPLAFIFRSYWALIAGMLAGRAGSLLASYWMHPFRPRWSLKEARGIWHYSKWIMVNNALGFLSARGAHLLIGRLGSPRDLGLYAVSYDIANLPTSELAMPINRAVFPGYAQIQHDTARMKSGFLRVFGVVALAALPAGFGLAMVAPTLVPLMLGQQWKAAVPVMQALAIGGAILTLQTNVESVYFATGRTRLRAFITGVQVAVVLPMTWWLVSEFGVIGAAIASLIGSIVVTTVNLWRASSLLEVSAHEIVANLWRPAVATLLMIGAVAFVGNGSGKSPDIMRLFADLALQVGTGVATFGLAILALWTIAARPESAESWLLGQVASLRARIRRN